MITLTITLKSTAHQIVLGYKSKESADANYNRDIVNLDSDGQVIVRDEFGQVVRFPISDLAWVTVQDLDAYRDYIIAKKAWALRTETAFSTYCQQNPDLAPYVGRGPGVFGER